MKTPKYITVFLVMLLALMCSMHKAVAGKKTTGAGSGPDKQVQLDLFTLGTGNIETYIDAVTIRYNTGYLTSTSDDAEKTAKAGENISSYREAKDLSEEKRPLFYSTDTIFLHLTNTAIRDYRFKILMQEFNLTGLMAKVDDNYLNTSTLLNTSGGNSNIDFSITADPASADPFRFTIVIITARPLPVTITSFAATQQAKNIALEWKVSNQVNMLRYQVERSANGINFTKVAEQAVITGSSHTYNWVDDHTATGNNFYRICCVGIAGYISYSSIINVKMGGGVSGINVYPNPVTNNTIALQFTQMQKGIYNIALINSIGQIVYSTKINNNNLASTQSVSPAVNLAKGNYYLQIAGPDNLKVSKLVSVAR